MSLDNVGNRERLSISRPGYRLLEVLKCGIPVFLLKVDLLMLEKTQVEPVPEFILKALNRGFTTVSEIAGILGLSEELVVASVVALQQDDLVRQVVTHGRRELALTTHGLSVVESRFRESPMREQVHIGFDRLLWDVTSDAQSQLLKPSEMAEQGRLELKPVRKQRVQALELDLNSIDREARSLRGRSLKPLLLAVASIVRTNRMFLPVEIAIFESIDQAEAQLAVLIDGRESQSHEAAIAQLGGLAFLELGIAGPGPEAVSVLSEDYGPDIAASLAAEAVSPAVRDEIRRTGITAEFVGDGRVDHPSNLAVVGKSSGITTSQVEFIDTFEHQPYLRRALRESKERLVIISPWISAQVVTKEFLEDLRQLLRRGVRVHIGYGLAQRPGDRKVSLADEKAEESLRNLSDRFGNFVFVNLGNTHSKQLLFDDVHISGSFNWLSFQGSRNKEYRHEESTVIRKKSIVDQKYLDLCARIGAGV